MSLSKPRIKRAKAPLPEWTFGVYMVGGPELGPSISRDLLELERAGSSPAVNVVVGQQRRPASHATWWEIPPRNGTGLAKRKRIGPRSKPAPAAGPPVNGPRKRSLVDVNLTQFLDMLATEYQAKRYLLMLWGHASGLGFGGLKPGSKGDQTRLGELRKVLGTLRNRRDGTQKLEILGFCACAVNKADYALELRDEVEYLVASQVGISVLMTWPFDEAVKLLLSSPAAETGSVAHQLVQCYEEGYEPPPVAMTALHLKESERIGEQIDRLCEAILTGMLERSADMNTLNSLLIAQAFDEAMDAYPWEVEPLIDLFDLCRKLLQKPLLEEPIRERARAVLDQGFRSFVVHNARSGPKFGALNGLSMLAPDFDDPDWLETCDAYTASSSNTVIASKTRWAMVTRKVYEFFRANPNLFG